MIAGSGHAAASRISTPPSAGPITRATLTPMLLSETAGASSPRDTSSGTIAWNTGIPKASVVPKRNDATRITAGVVKPNTVESPSSSDKPT
jgi:hypothetical protein